MSFPLMVAVLADMVDKSFNLEEKVGFVFNVVQTVHHGTWDKSGASFTDSHVSFGSVSTSVAWCTSSAMTEHQITEIVVQ